MRSILIYMHDGKYTTEFLKDKKSEWLITSYIIVSHEIMVDWIEKGIHPEWRYT